MHGTRLIVAGLALLTVSSADAAGIFTVSGRKIFLDGSVFEVRGVCYQPTPIGENPSAAPPYGDYFTAGYSNLWARDFANLRNMGANVVRCYGWTIGADHSAFLDAAYNGGDQSLYFLVNKWINPATDWSNAGAVNALVSEWEAIAMELKDHPAVMGFLIGNEINGHNGNGSKPDFWSAMNQIAGAVKAVATNKLVSVPLWDTMGHVQSWDASMSNLDFWGIQAYRGTGFGPLFADYETYSTKPLVLTEFGYDAYDAANGNEFADDADLPADAMEYLWREIRYNREVVSGGCVFEYTDEWWKAGNPSTHDTTGWPGGAFIDGEGNEEWWGVFRVIDNGMEPDLLEPRAMFFRLAAMWNEPVMSAFQQTGTSNGLLQTTIPYPSHLRDQQLRLQMSGDLDTWRTVARNSASSSALESYGATIGLTADETNQEIRVSLEHDPSADVLLNPHNLLANGDFETVNTLDWLTWGILSTDVAEGGSRSLKLAAAGGWTVPLAFQTISALPGEEYNLSGYMYTPAPLPADATLGLFKIVFRDESGTDLPPASISIGNPSGDPTYPGAESWPVLNATSPAGIWMYSQAQAVAPSNTSTVSFYILNVDQSAGTMYFDSVQAVETVGIPAITNAAFFRIMNQGR